MAHLLILKLSIGVAGITRALGTSYRVIMALRIIGEALDIVKAVLRTVVFTIAAELTASARRFVLTQFF